MGQSMHEGAIGREWSECEDGREKRSALILALHAHENFLAVLHQELEDIILLLNISHLTGETFRSHDCWRKDHGNILTRHQILCVALDYASEMEDKELQDVAVHARQLE